LVLDIFSNDFVQYAVIRQTVRVFLTGPQLRTGCLGDDVVRDDLFFAVDVVGKSIDLLLVYVS